MHARPSLILTTTMTPITPTYERAMCVLQRVNDHPLDVVVCPVTRGDHGVAVEEVLQQATEVCRQRGDELEGKRRRVEIHIGNGEISQQRKQRVRTESARPIHDDLMNETALERRC